MEERKVDAERRGMVPLHNSSKIKEEGEYTHTSLHVPHRGESLNIKNPCSREKTNGKGGKMRVLFSGEEEKNCGINSGGETAAGEVDVEEGS